MNAIRDPAVEAIEDRRRIRQYKALVPFLAAGTAVLWWLA